jgi:hypothetical protein
MEYSKTKNRLFLRHEVSVLHIFTNAFMFIFFIFVYLQDVYIYFTQILNIMLFISGGQRAVFCNEDDQPGEYVPPIVTSFLIKGTWQ